MSGFNHNADVVDGKLVDFDGDKHALINQHEVTPRERDIIQLIGDGKADKQIADMLGISINTVLTIIARMREKMCATSKYHIVSMAAKAGII
jgi:DNA-binding CsgD family transcriptional regulator